MSLITEKLYNVYNPLESLNDDDAVIPIGYYKNNAQAEELQKKLEKKFNPIVFPVSNNRFDEGYILAVVCSDKQVDIVRKALSEKLEIPLLKWNKAIKFKKKLYLITNYLIHFQYLKSLFEYFLVRFVHES